MLEGNKKTEKHLHLGCGGTYLDGWVNVDKFDYVKGDTSRTNSKYDVRADLLALPFKDNCIDTVLTVHVLEHFYRWDTIDILSDIYRTLKTGGYLVIEMPDLDMCIRWYIDAKYDRHSGRTIKTPLGRLNKGFTQFFGNQWSRLEYETHKYLWSKSEIKEVLGKIGFKIIDIDNRVFFHMQHRDLRCIAIKE